MYLVVLFTWFLAMICYLLASLAFIPLPFLRRYSRSPRSTTHTLALLFFYGIPSVWLLDLRFPASAGLAAGILLWLGGGALSVWARAVNPYFVPDVVAPPEIITAGPYRFFDHPGYIGFGMMAAGAALMMGSPWCAIPMGLYWLLLLMRMGEEWELLRN